MSLTSAKASSVTSSGDEDGFVPEPSWESQRASGGDNRLLVSVPTERLQATHAALAEALEAPLGVLYRRHVNRAEPGPEGAPPTDFVALHQAPDQVMSAVAQAADLIFHDARCELWLRGKRGDQLILDQDGLLYCYPDDPAFRDVLVGLGLPEVHVDTMLERDYVKHWYHASNDDVERRLIDGLGLVQVG